MKGLSMVSRYALAVPLVTHLYIFMMIDDHCLLMLCVLCYVMFLSCYCCIFVFCVVCCFLR